MFFLLDLQSFDTEFLDNKTIPSTSRQYKIFQRNFSVYYFISFRKISKWILYSQESSMEAPTKGKSNIDSKLLIKNSSFLSNLTFTCTIRQASLHPLIFEHELWKVSLDCTLAILHICIYKEKLHRCTGLASYLNFKIKKNNKNLFISLKVSKYFVKLLIY